MYKCNYNYLWLVNLNIIILSKSVYSIMSIYEIIGNDIIINRERRY